MKNPETHTQTISLSTPGNLYDLSMLEEMDDTEYLLEILEILLGEASKDLKEMKEAIQGGYIDIACKKAHKLKSSAGVIQAEKFAAMLTDIETIAKKGLINNELICLVEYATNEYSNIERSLKIYVDGLK
jgi:HPt (histidine-containing phosphotransfer) domain-containing protein